ncbi:MAG: hypothetical protein IRZ03_12795 [Acidobacterium ailaaui]|nr:hypothetical protein [Pseudacidobacterium ailaaui]
MNAATELIADFQQFLELVSPRLDPLPQDSRARMFALLENIQRLADAQVLPWRYLRASYGLKWCIGSGRVAGTVVLKVRELSPEDLLRLVFEAAKEDPPYDDLPLWLCRRLGFIQ